jgi:hypothetical protein
MSAEIRHFPPLLGWGHDGKPGFSDGDSFERGTLGDMACARIFSGGLKEPPLGGHHFKGVQVVPSVMVSG